MENLLKPSRRGFIAGAAVLFCAPAIVRATSLMPVKARETVISVDIETLPFEYTWSEHSVASFYSNSKIREWFNMKLIKDRNIIAEHFSDLKVIGLPE